MLRAWSPNAPRLLAGLALATTTLLFAASLAWTPPAQARDTRLVRAEQVRFSHHCRHHRRRCAAKRTRVSSTDPSPPLEASALDAASVALSWPDVPGAARVQVWRDQRLVDEFPWSSSHSYADRGLWQSTSYAYSVRALDGTGAEIARFHRTISTPARTGDFPRLYADSSFVNTPVGPSPQLDPGSAAMISRAVVPYVGSANMTNDPNWGIPISYGDAQSNRYVVGCYRYWCDLAVPPFPIPASAQPSHGSDGHLVTLDSSGNELDMWATERTADGGWTAGSRTVISSSGSGVACAPGETCARAVAAGFAAAAGIVRPEEVAQGHIDHALVMTTPYTRADYAACPAIGSDGPFNDPAALPEGAHLQLDPSVDIGALAIPAWQKVIAEALKTYGAYVVDTGGSLSIRAESNVGRGYDAWAKAGVPNWPNLSGLPWDRLRVLKMTKCA